MLMIKALSVKHIYRYAASEAAEQTPIVVKIVPSYLLASSPKASPYGLPCAMSIDDSLGSPVHLEPASHFDGNEVGAYGSAKSCEDKLPD